MATAVTMPKMGYDMTEGTILRWLKQPGEAVAKGEVLGEIETGKVNIEIEAFDAGELGAILVPEGATVPVGTAIAVLVAPGEAVPAEYTAVGGGASPAESAATGEGTAAGAGAASSADAHANGAAHAGAGASLPTPAAAVQPLAVGNGRVKASPLARRLAREHGVDLAAVAGTGPGGRVLRDDVVAAVAGGVGGPAGQPATAPIVAPLSVPAPSGQSVAAGAAGVGDRQPLSRMRQTIARRLVDSWTTAPHIFVTMAVDMTEALALREQVNGHLAATGGGKVSVNDLVVKAAARALRLEPRLNASWDDGARVQHTRIHVGVAVALDDGLITLTVADADVRSLSLLAADVAAMAERARAGKLLPEDVSTPSTFTVSNLGMYGVEDFTAILNPPEAGILAVGAAVPSAVVRDGAVVVRPIMKVTLSADHRVVDGATAAQFLVHLRQTLENPLAMLV